MWFKVCSFIKGYGAPWEEGQRVGGIVWGSPSRVLSAVPLRQSVLPVSPGSPNQCQQPCKGSTRVVQWCGSIKVLQGSRVTLLLVFSNYGPPCPKTPKAQSPRTLNALCVTYPSFDSFRACLCGSDRRSPHTRHVPVVSSQQKHLPLRRSTECSRRKDALAPRPKFTVQE